MFTTEERATTLEGLIVMGVHDNSKIWSMGSQKQTCLKNETKSAMHINNEKTIKDIFQQATRNC